MTRAENPSDLFAVSGPRSPAPRAVDPVTRPSDNQAPIVRLAPRRRPAIETRRHTTYFRVLNKVKECAFIVSTSVDGIKNGIDETHDRRLVGK